MFFLGHMGSFQHRLIFVDFIGFSLAFPVFAM